MNQFDQPIKKEGCRHEPEFIGERLGVSHVSKRKRKNLCKYGFSIDPFKETVIILKDAEYDSPS
jgi:hypothetical protein